MVAFSLASLSASSNLGLDAMAFRRRATYATEISVMSRHRFFPVTPM